MVETNYDYWGADHCVDADVVPRALFANRSLQNIDGISFRDIPLLVIGKHLYQSHVKPLSHTNPGKKNWKKG